VVSVVVCTVWFSDFLLDGAQLWDDWTGVGVALLVVQLEDLLTTGVDQPLVYVVSFACHDSLLFTGVAQF